YFNSTNGAYSYSSMMSAADGTLCGTTSSGGSLSGGNIFRVLLSGELLPLVRQGIAWKVNFVGLPGDSYHVPRAPGPGGPWTPLANVPVAPDGHGQFTDNLPPPNTAFYRIAFP